MGFGSNKVSAVFKWTCIVSIVLANASTQGRTWPGWPLDPIRHASSAKAKMRIEKVSAIFLEEEVAKVPRKRGQKIFVLKHMASTY